MKVFILNPNFNLEKKSAMNVRARQPLSLAIIAELLRQKNFQIELLDANVLQLSLKQTLDKIKNFKPDILILTTTPIDRWECPHTHLDKIFKLINLVDVKNKILVGSHGTVSPDWIFSQSKIDFIVRGEPEIVVDNLVNALKNKTNLKDILGISYRQLDKIFNNPDAPRNENLDTLPFPAYDLLPMQKYSSGEFDSPFSIMLTSRGCPYTCIYCLKAMSAGKYLTQSPERVLAEIEHLIKNFKIKSIYFQDWEFCVDNYRVEKICQLILDKNLKFNWGCNARADDLVRSPDLLKLMKQAGCQRINLGLESASDKVLTKINKKMSVDQLQQAVDLLTVNNLQAGYYVLLNCPGETHTSLRETIDFILKNNLKVKNFNLPIPYPGTQLFKNLNKNITWPEIEKFAGKIQTRLNPNFSKFYLRHYKFTRQFGKFYLFNFKFWQKFFKKI